MPTIPITPTLSIDEGLLELAPATALPPAIDEARGELIFLLLVAIAIQFMIDGVGESMPRLLGRG